MQKYRNLSFFTKNVIFSSINIVLVGAMLIFASYIIQQHVLVTQLHKQIQVITDNWAKGIDSAKIKEAITEKNYEGPVQTALRDYLSSVNKFNPNIAQAYIFGTELQDGNKTSLVAMPTSLMNDFKKENVMIGDMYEQPQTVATALQEMLKTGQPTFTSFYSDMFGTWATIAYPIKDANGQIFAYFAADADASAVPNGLKTLLTYEILILLVFLLILILLQYFISRKTLAPIRHLIDGIDEVSKGNFEVQVPTGKDDLGLINEKFNDMVGKIRGMLIKVSRASDEVTSSARHLLTISEQNSEHTQKITHNIQEIAGNIQKQEQATIDSSKAMAEMAVVISNIAGSSSAVSDEAHAMETISTQGNAIIDQVSSQMGLISQSVTTTSQSIHALGNRSREIGDILSIITGISSQTNLLALNAAIEAARVGEQGRGFAVVAGEVRKLAEQSEHSAQQITVLIKEIQADIANAVESMEKGMQEVQTGIEVTEQTGTLFTEIITATQKVSSQIQEVSSATQEISAGTEEMTATAEELNSTARKTALTSNSIRTAVHAQTASMQSVVDASNKLTSLSVDLQDLITQFHVQKKQ
ncbi:HAMP domain-containing methyl-accepting chemotaxis protein [Paenibacillus sp. N1-5-1-14]|uniref:methyl-accepting chemotaxis protein n=1 Tax=Paenibacillus radicibacter TaxID=2972488 RepID=UPI00215946D4|nr:HAMP domain-containing methyl-accepting chemotaxis protein [Paenibacillus radicibacter]MCR8642738.1 HAMP domain-containing methyl-accepting chemotaxis protein [Paenibacillus radicibacter]